MGGWWKNAWVKTKGRSFQGGDRAYRKLLTSAFPVLFEFLKMDKTLPVYQVICGPRQ